jgi:hypothetical protein
LKEMERITTYDVITDLEESVGTFNIKDNELLIDLVMGYIFRLNHQTNWRPTLMDLRSDLVYYNIQTEGYTDRNIEELIFKINHLLNP